MITKLTPSPNVVEAGIQLSYYQLRDINVNIIMPPDNRCKEILELLNAHIPIAVTQN